MKKLYEFTIEKEEEVVEEEVIHEDDGTTTTKSKKVKKFVPRKFFLRKPSHSMIDEASLYYGVELARAVKAGMLTESMLRKRFEEDGGLLSTTEEKAYDDLYTDLRGVMEEVAKIEGTTKKLTKAQKNKLNVLQKEKDSILQQIQVFENNKSSLFNQTAESRARNKSIVWWVLTLSYEVEPINDTEVPVWGTTEQKMEERINDYYEWNEAYASDAFSMEVKFKFLYYISFWFNSSASDQESFENVAKRADEEITRELQFALEEIKS
tara:strand:+ start:5106 stop:5903 length:798 start_codon:yes stop_codon:yes gene_type:complete